MPDYEQTIRHLHTTHPQSTAAKPGYAIARDVLLPETISDLHHVTADQGLVRRIDRNVFKDPTLEFGGGFFRLEPGWSHILHLHKSSAEFYYLLSGTARLRVGDELIDGEPGLCVYVPAGMPHGLTGASPDGFEFLYMFSEADPAKRDTVWLEG